MAEGLLPPNKGMKLTKLRAAPVRQAEVPPCAVRRFAAARTASQLIPGVRRTNGGGSVLARATEPHGRKPHGGTESSGAASSRDAWRTLPTGRPRRSVTQAVRARPRVFVVHDSLAPEPSGAFAAVQPATSRMAERVRLRIHGVGKAVNGPGIRNRTGRVLSGKTGRSPNKGMKLTKLRAAPVRRAEVPPCAFRRFAAARTASQLIPGVGRTLAAVGQNKRVWPRIAVWRIVERFEAARARCAPYSAYGTHLCKATGRGRGQAMRQPAWCGLRR